MPPLDAESMALLNYYLASQTNLDPMMQGMLGGLISPNVNKYGDLDQFGVDLEKTNLNQYQDIAGTFGNPMNTLLSGLGAVGPAPLGGGVVGGGGLNPITTEKVLETPATLQTRYLAQLFEQGQPGQRSLEGLIASKLLSGQDPSLIMTDLQAKLNDPQAAGLDPTEAALFRNSLPQKDVIGPAGQPTGDTTIDWNATRKWIEDKATPYLAEQGQLLGPNITQNNYGQYVSLSEQPSEMMQYLQKLGLPDPRAQYGIDFSVQNDPQLAELMTNIGAKGQAFDQARQTYEKYLKDRPIAQALARQAEGMGDKRKQEYTKAMADYASGMAEWAKTQPPPPTTAEKLAAERESYNGSPGWMKAIGGGISDLASGTGDYLSDTLARMGGRPNIKPGLPIGSAAPVTAPPPQRPTLPTLRGPSLIEQMYARANGGGPNQQYALAGRMNDASRAQGEDLLAMVRAIAPSYAAQRAGRSPFKDAIMQRLQPILAVGGARR